MTIENNVAAQAGDEPMLGLEEGALCNRDGCTGTMEWAAPENCSCHISPPCNACMEVPLTCDLCSFKITN